MEPLLNKDRYEPGSGEAPSSLQVLLLYDASSSAVRAKRLVDQLVEHVNLIVSFRLNLCRFDLLAAPGFGVLQPDHGLEGDIVFLAAQGDRDLPPGVWAWLERWLAHDPHQPRALVMALDQAARDLPVARQMQYFLQSAAYRAGVEVFSHFGQAPSSEFDTALAGIRYRAETTSTVLDESLHSRGAAGFRSWGIND